MKKLLIVFAAVMTVAMVFNSCQKDDLAELNPVLKSVITDDEGSISLTYPDKVYAGKDFLITFSACDDAVLERGASGNDCDSDLGWEEIGVYTCGDDPVELTENLEEPGKYVYRIIVTALEDGVDDTCNECVESAEELTACFEITVCREETAFGGDDKYFQGKNQKSAWFFYYDPEPKIVEGEPEEIQDGWLAENIYADGGWDEVPLPIGTVQLVYNEELESYELVILLDCGWELRELSDDGTELSSEQVKVKWYEEAPSRRARGNEYDYKGSDLVVPVEIGEGETEGFLIHLDVEFCEACQEPV